MDKILEISILLIIGLRAIKEIINCSKRNNQLKWNTNEINS